MLTRRELLKAGALAGAGLMLPMRWSWAVQTPSATTVDPGTLARFIQAMPIPPGYTPSSSDQTKDVYNIAIGAFSQNIHPSLPDTPLWGYGGTFPSRTIEAERSRATEVTFTNQLGSHLFTVDESLHGPNHPHVDDQNYPRTSVHLHGGNSAPEFDGYPEDTFVPVGTPGEVAGTQTNSHFYRYDNRQDASTLWFHDHALGITGMNVMGGMAGFYLLRDDYERSLELPSDEYEIPIVIQDRAFLPDGRLFYPHPWEPEFFGDVAVVNGKAWPYLEVDRGMHRFRILNGSNARFYRLRFSNGMTFFQIGAEGGFLPKVAPMTELTIAPGERADVLVDFNDIEPGSQITWTNDAGVPFPSGRDLPLEAIMQFRVRSNRGLPFRLPSLAPIPRLDRSGAKTRDLSLVEIMDEEGPLMSLLNNMAWDDPITEAPKAGSVEVWRLINLTGDTHPIHLHLVHFQVLNRQRIAVRRYSRDSMMGTHPLPPLNRYLVGKPRPAAPNERGWKDTVMAHPGEVTRIVVPFGGSSLGGKFAHAPFEDTRTGRYVWHCHILEHEDNEMMRPYEVMS